MSNLQASSRNISSHHTHRARVCVLLFLLWNSENSFKTKVNNKHRGWKEEEDITRLGERKGKQESKCVSRNGRFC